MNTAAQSGNLAVPATMRAWVLDDPGQLRLTEKPVPQPGPAEVLVRVDAIVCLPQTPFGWRVTPNRVMLLLNERYFQADFASGHRAFPIKGFA
jgi:L-iditol 2-dehydrogenase